MPFSQAELDNISAASLDFFIKKQPDSQVKQERPFYDAMMRAKKMFPGGRGRIDGPVKGVYTTGMTGYTHDDQVTYGNPANIRRWNYTWREHHAGIGVTLTELKHDGISVTDSARGDRTSNHSQREMTALVNLLEDKLEDMTEGSQRAMSTLLLGDGTGDANALAGIRALISTTPNTGTRGGIDAAANAWWRNRAFIGVGTNATGPAIPLATELPLFFKTQMRQLRRFGGRPNFIMAGSGFLDRLVSQLYDKGTFTQQGWTLPKSTDITLADVSLDGVGFVYEPGLDDASLTNRCYVIDTRRLCPYVMEGEEWKPHNPSRPHDRYVMYRAVTWTGQLAATQMNCHMVADLA